MPEPVVVEASCGKLRGARKPSFEGYEYCSFKGIPYAKPPIGELRFKDPVALEPWSGEREATKFGPECGQMDKLMHSAKGEDDCLYLNVFVKSIKPDARLPVMVWIHGGGFTMGSGDDLLYGPDFFLRKDIVLVTINYRVGVLGFLNFDDEAAYGNQGLKDQVLSLRWVQENIASFGGDPNNVTIFGESAGAASVHYLALSPLSEGLFHKAISQSGVACNPWGSSAVKESAYKLCEILGNDSKDPKTLVKFLRTIDCHKLIKAQEDVQKTLPKFNDLLSFGPTVDSKAKEPFMPVHPSEAMENGVHVPYLLGCNSCEGIFHLIEAKDKDFEKFDNKFEECLGPATREMLRKNNITPSQLRNLYFGDEKISKKNSDKLADMCGDLSFVEGIHRVVKCQVQRSSAPTYFYRFTYDKGFSILKTWAETTLPGTCHFDEVHFLFSMRMYELLDVKHPERGSADYKVMEQMTEMWVNFAKYGRPTPEVSDLIPTYWLPVTDEKVFRTLNIGNNLRMENTLNLEENYSYGKYMKHKL